MPSIDVLNLPQEKESETTSNFKTSTTKRLTSIDVLNLPQDPGKRRWMSQFHPSDRDIVIREYCSRDFCQTYKHEFKLTKFGEKTINLIGNGLMNTKHGLSIVLTKM